MRLRRIIQWISWITGSRDGQLRRTQIGVELVRLVSVSIRHEVNPARWVGQLAGEYTGRDRRALLKIANAFEAGRNPADAFRAVPKFFGADVLLAFEVGQQTQTLDQAFRDHLNRQDFAIGSHAAFTQKGGLFGKLFIGFVALQIWVFVMLSVLPTIEDTFNEFELKLPAITSLFVGVSHWLSAYWWILIFGYLICAVVRAMLSQSWRFKEFILIFFSRTTQRRRQACLLRSIANVIEAGASHDAAIETITSRHPSQKLKRRMMDLGDQASCWNKMQMLGLVSSREAASLSGMPGSTGAIWLVRRLADLREMESLNKLSLVSTLWSNFQTLAFAVFVMTFCLAVYLPLVSLISGLT